MECCDITARGVQRFERTFELTPNADHLMVLGDADKVDIN